MSQAKNTTAPPTAQVSVEPCFGYWVVMVKQSKMTLQGVPLISKGLAVELARMLLPEFPGRELYVQAFNFPAELSDELKTVASRNKDMVISCRSADRPGHEYISRLGHQGMYSALLDLDNDGPCHGYNDGGAQ